MRRLGTTLGTASVILAGLSLAACGSGLRATTMRLERHEGEVALTDKKGKDRPIQDDLRFQDGDELGTGEKSLAGISLDDTKAVLLDEESKAEFFQGKDGDWIEIDLTEGNLFYNVKEKLKEGEEFEIHTSTMVLGIRGTSGYVTGNDDGKESMIVTDGVVHLKGTNPDTGESTEVEVPAGKKATANIYDRETGSIEFSVDEVTEADLPPLAIRALTEDDELMKRVCNDTGWNEGIISVLPKEEESLSVYKPILDMYARNLERGWAEKDDEGYDDVMDPDNASYLWQANYFDGKSLDTAGFAFIDLNGDGNAELIVASVDGAARGEITEVYTSASGELVHPLSLTDRAVTTLINDNKIFTRYNGSGAQEETVSHMTLADPYFEDEELLLFQHPFDETDNSCEYYRGEQLKEYWANISNPNYRPSVDPTISEERADELSAHYDSLAQPYSITTFADYSQNHVIGQPQNTTPTAGNSNANTSTGEGQPTAEEVQRAAEIRNQLGDDFHAKDAPDESLFGVGDEITLQYVEGPVSAYVLPDTTSTKVFEFPVTDSFTVLGVYNEDEWILINYNGQEGYISGDNIRV